MSEICHGCVVILAMSTKDRIAIANIKLAKFEEPAVRALQKKAENCHVRKTRM